MADPFWRYLPDLAACLIIVGVHYAFTRRVKTTAARLVLWALAAWVILSFCFSLPGMANDIPRSQFLTWARGVGISWGMTSLGVFLVGLVWRRIPDTKFSPGRRRLLNAARSAMVAAPVAVTGFGVFVERHWLSVREQKVAYSRLPKDLDGLRIVQLSDIHYGPFLNRQDLARAVDMANETKAHLAVVTGDLITTVHDSLDDCLLELARLRSGSGILACLGNHEIHAAAEDYAEEQGAKRGIRFLRSQARRLRFGQAVLNLAGVDYQRINRPYLARAEKLVSQGEFNVLLSHNPDVFPVARRKGFQLTLSGHTHGGQIAVEILSENLSMARFFTPFVYGLYTQGPSSIYVSRGIGTVGLPARIGAPPEVSLVRLCAT
jgi:predicted MPP superfamily phosphohydrolase